MNARTDKAQREEKSASRRTAEARTGPIAAIRGWIDPLVVAFLLAMFIRLFVVEMFRIPSSSMTPTLLGMESARLSFVDVDDDGDEDMLLREARAGSRGYAYDYFRRDEDRFHYAGRVLAGPHESLWRSRAERREDQILVNKFSYWFSSPERGDIVVFKTPPNIFEPSKPIFIKRVVGLPGEKLEIRPAEGVPGHENSMGRLVADGELVDEPAFFRDQLNEYRSFSLGQLGAAQIPEDALMVFGDNTVGSQDSRYWGPVPLNHLRGKAILRLFKDPKFLK